MKQKIRKRGVDTEAEMTPEERLKLQVLEELGLLEKVQKEGWKSLTLAECGRVGGILNSRMKKI